MSRCFKYIEHLWLRIRICIDWCISYQEALLPQQLVLSECSELDWLIKILFSIFKFSMGFKWISSQDLLFVNSNGTSGARQTMPASPGTFYSCILNINVIPELIGFVYNGKKNKKNLIQVQLNWKVIWMRTILGFATW